ncbi:anti-sigma factor [Arthrobacter sp. ATA002]|uniref:anti-sigma factor n=1 Tax=Arthrobacter sp. ATA002 TaxID=2991715 RepID=UPI0022A72D9B|nr:anti-sigma factor [Arthrobacter sp. ATA002]WAP52716.1 anti-sigma factor [Arthrobacter sp. ATA002]
MTDNSSDAAPDAPGRDLSEGRLLEWAELYALNALPRDERQDVDTALEEADPAVRRAFLERVWTARETLAGGYRAEEQPPADLFDKILSRLPGQDAGGPGIPRVPDSPSPSPAEEVDEVAARRSRRSVLRSAPGRWILAGAAAAAIVVGGVALGGSLGPDSVREEVLQASDVQQRTMELPTGGTAEVATSAGEDAAVVTLSGVPAPPEGSVYQMWRVPADGSDPVSVGTMTGEDVSGAKATELTGIDPYSAVALTLEPDGGSPTPTLPILLVIPFSA